MGGTPPPGRFDPLTIPAYSSPKHTFWFHQNRSRITQVIVVTNLGYRVQRTAYRLTMTPPKSTETCSGTSKKCKKTVLEKKFFLAEINTFPFFHIHESGKVKHQKWIFSKNPLGIFRCYPVRFQCIGSLATSHSFILH